MIKLRMNVSLAINGTWCDAGSVIEADGALADSLLRRGVAVPDDPHERRLWRESQPPPKNWVLDGARREWF